MAYNRTTLDNGIRILTEPMPYVRSVSLGIWVKTGSRCEEPQEQGISHFLEHMVFKGTERRTARMIAEEFDSVGGQVNALTSREYTCFYAKVLDTHLELAMDILADMITSPKFAHDELEREKGVVIEEIKLYEDTPEELVHDLSAQAVFGKHPLGVNVLGTEETVASFNESMLRDYMKRWYTPKGMVVSAAGNLDHQHLVDMAQDKLGILFGEDPPAARPAGLMESNLILRKKDVEQTHFCMCGPGAPRSNEDKMPLLILETALGGGMSSRLFQELREERGLVYSAYSYHTSFQDTGVLSVYAGLSPANLPLVIELIRKEFADLRENGISHGELDRAKEQLKGNMVLGLESTNNRQSRLAKMELFYDGLYTPEEVLDKIQGVTGEQVLDVCRKSLSEGLLALAVVGPQKNSDVKKALGNLITVRKGS